MDLYDRIGQLPDNFRTFVSGNDVRLEFERACLTYGLSESQMEKISEKIGLVIFKDLAINNLPSGIIKLGLEENVAFGLSFEIVSRICAPFPEYFPEAKTFLQEWNSKKKEPLFSVGEVEKKLLELEPWIVEEENERNHEIKKEVERLASLPLEQISDKYPEVLEQLLSNAFIRLRKFSEPVRPSIKNWISDYHEQMGLGKHGTFDRGNYLFHSENTKALSSVERQKVSTILKSLDENTLLAIDPEKQEVVFETGGDSNLRIDTRIDKGFEQKSTNSGQGIANYEQKRTENLQRSTDNGQQIASNLQQAANSRQQATSNRQQTGVAVDGMRIVKEAEKTLPAAGVAKPVQMQYQKPENVQPFKSQLVQGFGRTTAAPMDTRRKVINPSESFGNYAIPEGDLVRKKPDVVKKEDNFPLRASYEAPRSPQVVENKTSTAPQNFGNDIAGFQKQQPQPAKKIFSESIQGGQQQGKVSFSSPQQLPVEKKQDSAKRTPFRIVPHGDL